jgi:cysteine desulfurase/selenocysteine lyase
MYNIAKLREEFPILSKCIYLDSASTSQTPRRAVDAMCEYFFEYAANHGRGAHHLARKTTEKYEETRNILGNFLKVPPENLVFTKNTTDSINLVANGFPWKRGDEVITTFLEHHSNLLPWMMLKSRGVHLKIVSHTNGYITPVSIQEAITKKTRLIAVTHMPNILGTVQPVEEIGRLAHDSDVPIIVDGAQSVGHFPVDLTHIDYMGIPGHKGLLGPQGTGALYLKDPDSIRCSVFGGGIVAHVSHQKVVLLPPPAKFEPGTPNIPGVIGLAPAIKLVEELGVDNIHAHEKRLGHLIHKGLSGIPEVDIYSPPGTGVVSFNVAGKNPNALARQLDDYRKICVRSGMHCAEPLSSSYHCEGTVRASVGCYTTEDEVKDFIGSVDYLVGGGKT